MKTCILKPIMWNDKKYVGPSGHKSSSGFSKDNGFGHEEWNNNPKWVWQGFKIFHTEAQPKLLEYSKNGDLAILMIASFEKQQYALGIATNVYCNDIKEEMKIIADELNLRDNIDEIWIQDSVKKCYKNDFTKFAAFWESNYTWVQWKCPTENYLWFEKPILLNAKKISGKNKVIGMHGSYQAVHPETILGIIGNKIQENSVIYDWLTDGEFNRDIVDKSIVKSHVKRKSSKKNSTSKNSFSYWVEGIRSVEPLHALLQAKYIKHLGEKKLEFKQNRNYIDVQYTIGDKTFLCELKPTEKVETKYAIRYAIGQLFEYKFKHNSDAQLEIVLSTKPKEEEIKFVKSLGLKLTYLDCESKIFVEC